jgi:transposase
MPALNCVIWLYRNFRKDTSKTSIVIILNVSRRLVNEWVTKYLSGGFDALALKLATGQPSRLSKEQKVLIKKYVVDHAVKAQ